MAKSKSNVVYVCQSCGAHYPRWQGRCSECGQWNSVQEEVVSSSPRPLKGVALGSTEAVQPLPLSQISAKEEERFSCGLSELDQVLGGGLVPGSLVLVGGPPGIGKSTLLLQAAAHLAEAGREVLYVSGEESPQQIKLRAQRLGIVQERIRLVSATSLEVVGNLLERERPQLAIIDSIQTMYAEFLESAPGSVTQIRECAAALMRLAKRLGCAIILVGHITKGGELAGPRVLEHLVDAVLSFDSFGLHNVRASRALKNRFGSTQETGFFAMEAQGLTPIPDASAFFLSQRAQDITGSLIFPSLEGTRPILVEIQALVTESYAASLGAPPTRRAVGVDANRLGLLLAVLQKRFPKLGVAQSDIYVNVAGGVRLNEPALDLPLLLAIASSKANLLIPSDWAALGEVGLGGEVRAVSGVELRLRELQKLGFRYCLVPKRGLDLKGSPFKIASKVRLREAAARSKALADPIGELTLGPPAGNELEMRQWAAAWAERKADSQGAEGEKVRAKAAPVQRAGEGGPLEVVPVDNLAEALQVLGLRPEQGPHAHSSKRPPREVPF